MYYSLLIFFILIFQPVMAQDVCDRSLDEISRYIRHNSGPAPEVNFSCISKKHYAQEAILVFAENRLELFDELDSLEEKAKELRRETHLELYDIEEELRELQINGRLTNEKRGEFAQSLAIMDQHIAMETRIIENMIGNVRATGTLLSAFIPLMRSSKITLINSYGFESLDEVYMIRDFMTQYGRDLRDVPFEVNLALRQIDRLKSRMNRVYSLLDQ